jgi:ATP-dependent Lon protease
MELIEFTGYTEKEKCQIARNFIIPRQLKAAGLNNIGIDFSEEAVSRVISDYTRESGLRNLEREIANVCRKLALLYLDSRKTEIETKIEAGTIAALLGPRKFIRNSAEHEPKVGITTGLVWSAIGGEIISVETASMKGSGKLLLTGSLGEVLQESAQAALSLIRSRSAEFGIKEYFFKDMDIHIHFPAGGIAKDGPSAGITIFAALLSLLTQRPARRDIAMTGEMTLSGRILPIGGIREKLLAAQRAGIKTVLLPLANKEEVEILPADVLDNIEVILVDNADEVVPRVLLAAA